MIGPDLSVRMSYVQTDTGQIPRTNPEWEIQETRGCRLDLWCHAMDSCFVFPVFKAYLVHLSLFVTLILSSLIVTVTHILGPFNELPPSLLCL